MSDETVNWSDYFYYDETSPSCLRWKESRKGEVIAGDYCGYINNQGYWSVMLYGKNYLQHRVIYEMCNNIDLGKDCIDHIDGVRSNNRLSNLRVVSKAINNRNCKVSKNNTSGIQGVYSVFKSGRKYWVAKWRILGSLQRHKYFRVDVYGDIEAKSMAEKYRQDRLIELNFTNGFGYSERHILGKDSL